ncbi:hypothetical protein TCDM_11042 [Trypanosoma cruzi Dm28c]|uniref:Uncharacterized protein n=1 Tax=Trypanosoma cruzi Dm28c TaxID=1416333 RepID=V5B1F0_TRYCR|nr:hypothetical protein TCDM_11042 [Trypanosoma cruzi Dm28c]PBJ77041.1 hypothetical protein BCY84_07356 [Trypanosoma cruzi cruzi]
MLFLFCWRPVDAAARSPPCVKALPALGVILFFSLFLLCRVRALLGVCWCVTDGATVASSGDNSRCALDTHPHTLSCLIAGVIAAGHCCERDGTTAASPLEKVPCSVGCVAARRFACSPTDRTAQSFHCGHSVGINRCGGVRRSRSPGEDGLVVVWQLGTSSPSPFRIALAARLARHQTDTAFLQECRHQGAPATRRVGCGVFHQTCSGRAGGVALLVRHTLLCECLLLVAHTAWRPLPSACAHRPAPACTW